MKYIVKNTLAVTIILLLFMSSSISVFASVDISTQETKIEKDTELYLLRGEHYLYLNATDNVNEFLLRFVFPPDYQYQVPTLLEIYNDTTADISHYQIEDDTNEPNKVINFTIGPIQKDESVLLHFSCWVLVKNHEFEDLPKYIKFPKKRDLPEETKIWLTSTKVVQVHNILIKNKTKNTITISSSTKSLTYTFTRLNNHIIHPTTIMQTFTNTKLFQQLIFFFFKA